jgi:Do/DeqQ family serine protease
VASSTAAQIQTPGGFPESPFVSVVEKALPAVVFVDVKKKVGGSEANDPQDELFKRFFGDVPHPRQRVMPSSGSGFIIDREGRVLTNNHVVRDAETITVTLEDKRSFKAKIVGADAETDVAVIQIEGDNLPTLPLGDSDQLRVGDWAIAIGNPLGVLRGSVTVGVISARGRTGLDIFGGTPQFQDFIQTDASINFGNSGGPLCNIRGEAIGINTAINPSGQGIGFAIPINLAKHVADQLIAHGSVKRSMMGVMLADLTPELAEGFGLARQDGVLIQRVLPGSPAEKAGLKRNDVVVAFDGQPVADREKFRLRVADTPTGKRVPIDVIRDGRRLSLTLSLTDRDEQFLAQNGGPAGRGEEAPQQEQAKTQTLGGLTVRELSSEEKGNLEIPSGVMVVSVKEGSSAEDAGIQPNDVIEEVNTRPVSSPATFGRLLTEAKSARKKNAVLLVLSPAQGGNNTRYVPLRLE